MTRSSAEAQNGDRTMQEKKVFRYSVPEDADRGDKIQFRVQRARWTKQVPFEGRVVEPEHAATAILVTLQVNGGDVHQGMGTGRVDYEDDEENIYDDARIRYDNEDEAFVVTLGGYKYKRPDHYWHPDYGPEKS